MAQQQIAEVYTESLSDNSTAYNVLILADDMGMKLACLDKKSAEAVAKAINDGCSYAESR